MTTSPLRIALITPLYETTDSSKSGIAKHFRFLADALAAQGHEVIVVHIPDYYVAPLPRGITRHGAVTRHCFPVQLPAILRRMVAGRPYVHKLLHMLWGAASARREIARLTPAPHVIETTSFNSLGLFLTAGRPPAITRVSTTSEQMSAAFQHFQSRAQTLVNWLERVTIRRSHARLTHTLQHAATVESGLGLAQGSFSIVPHGIPDAASTAAPPAPPWPGPTILFAGAFSERKGIDVVLAAAPIALKARTDLRLVIAGGPANSELATPHLSVLSAQFGPRFLFVPDPDDSTLQGWMEACNLFTAPSRYESFGLIFLEAMRAGKAVVATNVGGIPEVVADGKTGILVPPGDVAELAAAWLRCADDPAMCVRFGLAGRQRFLAHFTSDSMARQSVELYRRVIATFPR